MKNAPTFPVLLMFISFCYLSQFCFLGLIVACAPWPSSYAIAYSLFAALSLLLLQVLLLVDYYPSVIDTFALP